MKRTGFTLVEILIVVVILGILAAIVIPQFTDAASDARNSSVQSDLQTLRSAVELYKVQHGDTLPSQTINSSGVKTLDTSVVNFAARLTGYTFADGSSTTAGTAGALGPYLQRFPTNPNSSTPIIGATVVFFTAAAGANADVNPAAGWSFDTGSGKMSCCATDAQVTW